MISKIKATVLSVAAIVLVAAGSGCEPGATVTFENRIATRLTFYDEPEVDAIVSFSLEPFETKRISIFQHLWKDRLIARDPAGNVVFDKRIPYDELKKMEREGKPVVIEPPQ